MHGGAGSGRVSASQRACLNDTLLEGYRVLREGGAALDAVEQAIRSLERSGLFNAGVGARVQLDGARRMDASLMEGRRLQAGAVAAIEGIRHPISAARLVMERTDHVLLVGPQATRFARYFKLERQAAFRGASPSKLPPSRTLTLYRRMRRATGLETVGAVALDGMSTLAAGASTGGIGCMLPGRVGDSPLIGSGVYADDRTVAVSMTGLGESIIRMGIAKEIAVRIAGGAGAAATVRQVLAALVARIQGDAGALVLTRDGHVVIRHTTPRMAAGYWGGTGKPVVRDSFTFGTKGKISV